MTAERPPTWGDLTFPERVVAVLLVTGLIGVLALFVVVAVFAVVNS